MSCGDCPSYGAAFFSFIGLRARPALGILFFLLGLRAQLALDLIVRQQGVLCQFFNPMEIRVNESVFSSPLTGKPLVSICFSGFRPGNEQGQKLCGYSREHALRKSLCRAKRA